METKVFRMSIKEVDEEGKFQGYLSVFNNVDRGGDLVEPGAFKKALSENKAFPLLWAHSAQDPSNVIGTFHGKEDKHGLLIDGEFFLDQPGGREAHAVVKKLYTKGVKVGLSIGYQAKKWVMDEDKDKGTIRRLTDVELFEGSMTLFPMNDQALIQAVKEGLEQKPNDKGIEFRCGGCGETVLVIATNPEPDAKAIDTKEPAPAIPADDPPAENQTQIDWASFLDTSVKDFISIGGKIGR